MMDKITAGILTILIAISTAGFSHAADERGSSKLSKDIQNIKKEIRHPTKINK